MGPLTHWGHSVPHKPLVDGHSLDIWGDDDSVFSQVQLEGVPGPTTFGLHDIEGDASQQILKHGSDPDPMPLYRLEVSGTCHLCYSIQELCFSECATCVHGLVGK